jgi:6-phosphofructokinase 1
MGRDAGWLAMSGGIGGGADLIIIPEAPITMAKIEEHVHKRMETRRFSIVVVAEGAMIEGIEPAVAEGKVDQFGHAQLATRGIGTRLAELIEERLGVEARAIVLGHVQRGGSPTMFDRVLATRLGAAAVDFLHEGRVGVVAGIHGVDVVPVALADVVGRNRTVDPRFFRLVRQFAVAEEQEPAHR